MDLGGPHLIGSLIFSGIGFVAFVYGKKLSLAKPLILGLILCIFPYFVSNLWALYGVGGALTLTLFIFRD